MRIISGILTMKKYNMMDLLMEAEDEDSLKLEDEDITDLLLLFLTAGFDSSAISTLWAIIHLTEHPEALKKAKVPIELRILGSYIWFKPEEPIELCILGSYKYVNYAIPISLNLIELCKKKKKKNLVFYQIFILY